MAHCSDHNSLYDLCMAIAPLVISLAVACIGWLQYKINRHKFRLDLYNRRFAVYESTLSYFQSYYSESSTAESTALSSREFIRAYRESFFLFGAKSGVYQKLTSLKDTLSFLCQHKERFTSKPYDEDEYRASTAAKQKLPDLSALMRALEDELLPWLDFRKIES